MHLYKKWNLDWHQMSSFKVMKMTILGLFWRVHGSSWDMNILAQIRFHQKNDGTGLKIVCLRAWGVYFACFIINIWANLDEIQIFDYTGYIF